MGRGVAQRMGTGVCIFLGDNGGHERGNCASLARLSCDRASERLDVWINTQGRGKLNHGGNTPKKNQRLGRAYAAALLTQVLQLAHWQLG